MTLKDKQKSSRIVANQALNALDELSGCAGFQWFLGRVRDIQTAHADDVLNNDALTAEAREALRQRFLALKDVLELPDAEAHSASSVLAAAGEVRNDLG